MAVEEEDSGCDIPEWVVTFGDMMSLLLTFFIMLVSLSEIKEEEKYQALVESVKKQFGHDSSTFSVVPGKIRPRNSALKNIATMGRAKRKDIMKGGDKVEAPVGDHPRVVLVRPGSKTAIGTVIYFEQGAWELTDDQKNVLIKQVEVIQGKPQKIELRGHTSRKPVSGDAELRDNWDLAYERCRQTRIYLTEKMKIAEERIRISVAAANEPVHIGTDPSELKKNPRVELYLLDEIVSDLFGTPEQLDSLYVE